MGLIFNSGGIRGEVLPGIGDWLKNRKKWATLTLQGSEKWFTQRSASRLAHKCAGVSLATFTSDIRLSTAQKGSFYM